MVINSNQDIKWRQGAELPLGRGSYASGIVEGRLILAGGTYWRQDRKQWLDETVAYEIGRDRWTQIARLPKPLAYGAGVVWRDEFYYLGGGGPEEAERYGYRLRNKAGNYAWEGFTELPRGFAVGAAQILDNRLYLIGGAGAKLETASPAVFSLNLSDSSSVWRSLEPIPGPGRALMASAVCASHIFIFGGMAFDTDGQRVNLRSAWRYSPGLNEWRRLRDVPIATRAWSASAGKHGYIYLLGGYSDSSYESSGNESPGGRPEGQFVNRVWRYDTQKDEYLELNPLPHALCDVSFHPYRQALYGAGGEPGPKMRAPWTFIGEIGQAE